MLMLFIFVGKKLLEGINNELQINYYSYNTGYLIKMHLSISSANIPAVDVFKDLLSW